MSTGGIKVQVPEDEAAGARELLAAAGTMPPLNEPRYGRKHIFAVAGSSCRLQVPRGGPTCNIQPANQ